MTTITLFYRNATNMRQLVLFVYLLLGNVLCAQQLADRTDIDWVRVADYGGGTICGASTFTINDYAYLSMGNEGGYTKNYKRTCYRYDPKTDVWKRMADLPSTATYREDGVGFSVNGKGYFTGGMYEGLYSYSYPTDTWEYNPATNLWYQRTSYPRPGGMWNGIAFTIDTLAYVGLGYAGYVDTEDESGVMNDFYQFNPKTNKWKRLNDFPGAPREDAVGFSMNGKGYVGLGYSYDLGSGYNYYTDFWEYDPAIDDWTRLPNFPGEGRTGPIGFGVDGDCYVGLGGINDFYKYNVKNKVWESLNYLPGGVRSFTNSFLVNNGIYYGGGSYSYSPYSDFWVYQLKTSTNTSILKSQQTDLIYPNPASEHFFVKGLDNLAEVKIYDQLGRLILQDMITPGKSVSVGHLTKGIYMVKVKSGHEVFDLKLMKE